jgi:hypothetical protein
MLWVGYILCPKGSCTESFVSNVTILRWWGLKEVVFRYLTDILFS